MQKNTSYVCIARLCMYTFEQRDMHFFHWFKIIFKFRFIQYLRPIDYNSCYFFLLFLFDYNANIVPFSMKCEQYSPKKKLFKILLPIARWCQMVNSFNEIYIEINQKYSFLLIEFCNALVSVCIVTCDHNDYDAVELNYKKNWCARQFLFSLTDKNVIPLV